MLLYLSNANPCAPENALYDVSNNPVYEFTTRTLWKSESAAVPHITQTEIVDCQSRLVVAQIDWDGPKPVYIDFGNGDERVMFDMVYPKLFSNNTLIFHTPGNLQWNLSYEFMELQSQLSESCVLARYYPNSRLTPHGKLEILPHNSKLLRGVTKDWLEINLFEFSPLSVAEVLVDFVILESLRRLSFWIPDPEPSPSPPPLTLSLKAKSRQSTGTTFSFIFSSSAPSSPKSPRFLDSYHHNLLFA